MGTTISVTAEETQLLGPLGDLFTIMTVPAQEAQYFTNPLHPAGHVRTSPTCSRRSNPNIQAVASFDNKPPPEALSTFFRGAYWSSLHWVRRSSLNAIATT